MTEPGMAADNLVRIDYRTPGRGRHTVMAVAGQWSDEPGSGLMRRPLTTYDGRTLMVQRTLARSGHRHPPPPYERLENEVRAAVRLGRRYGDRLPECLPHVVGHDLDAAEPFVLCQQVGGQPVARVAGQLLLSQRHDFHVGLFRCLTLLADAGLVHAGLDDQVVHWDGRTVRIADLSRCTVAGEPYPHPPSPPWSPPSARRLDAYAHPGDDVWAAGLLAFHVGTGQPVNGLDGPPPLAPDSTLASLLEGVFAAEPAARPDAGRLLRRLGAVVDRPGGPPPPDPSVSAGRAAFDEQRARKAAPQPPEDAPPRRRRSRRRPWPGPVAVALLVVLPLAGVALLVAALAGVL